MEEKPVYEKIKDYAEKLRSMSVEELEVKFPGKGLIMWTAMHKQTPGETRRALVDKNQRDEFLRMVYGIPSKLTKLSKCYSIGSYVEKLRNAAAENGNTIYIVEVAIDDEWKKKAEEFKNAD